MRSPAGTASRRRPAPPLTHAHTWGARLPTPSTPLQGTAMPSRGPWIDHFGDNFLWSNATLILKGMAPYGVVALEEIDRVCERLRGHQSDPKAWQEEWRAMGTQRESRGEAAVANGHKISAGDYYLRAGIYH